VSRKLSSEINHLLEYVKRFYLKRYNFLVQQSFFCECDLTLHDENRLLIKFKGLQQKQHSEEFHRKDFFKWWSCSANTTVEISRNTPKTSFNKKIPGNIWTMTSTSMLKLCLHSFLLGLHIHYHFFANIQRRFSCRCVQKSMLQRRAKVVSSLAGYHHLENVKTCKMHSNSHQRITQTGK